LEKLDLPPVGPSNSGRRIRRVKLVSFNAFRTLDIPAARYIKPELLFGQLDAVREADWILFPEYWQVNALVYGLKKRIFPSAASYHLGHDKVEMTRAFWSVCPENVPLTEICASTEANIDRILEWYGFPFVAKEVRSSMGAGVHLIENRAQLFDYAGRNDVLYIQEYLDIRRDMRIVYVGDRVVDAYWRVAEPGGFHNNVARGGQIVREPVPEEALALVGRVAQSLGVDHAGFDVAVAGGKFYLLEFNVLFGNQGLGEAGRRLGERILKYLGDRDDRPTGPDYNPPVAA
jgi:ribosomal protein S6--L-glutamate ligase